VLTDVPLDMPVEELTTDAAEWPSFADRQIAVGAIATRSCHRPGWSLSASVIVIAPSTKPPRRISSEARPDSDVDLLAAFDNARPLSLLDVIRIENQISDLLGHAVDLIEEGTLKPRARQSVDREAMRAF
jgi:hypothetical protein